MIDIVDSRVVKMFVNNVNEVNDVTNIINTYNQEVEQQELTEAFVRFFLNEEKRIEESDELHFDNALNQIINTVIQENENRFAEEIIGDLNLYETTSIDILDRLLITEITLNNYEELFCLKGLQSLELPPKYNHNIRTIRYKNKDGLTLAIVQINTDDNRFKLQVFGDVLPKQTFIAPNEVFKNIIKQIEDVVWTTEYGGINQFDGNSEFRYKDSEGRVMAAVITKPDGSIDTIVEYEYLNGKKSQMTHTSQFGQSKIVYHGEKDITRLVIDVDTGGNIFSITGMISLQ